MSEGSKQQLAGVMRVERRVARRFATSLGIAFVRNGQVFRATAVDVSMTGMRLHTEVDLEPGLVLSAHFSLAASAQMHLLEARVAWSVPSGEIAGLYVVGMEYRNLPPDTQEALGLLIRQLGGAAATDDLPLAKDEHVTAVTMPSGAVAAPRPTAGLGSLAGAAAPTRPPAPSANPTVTASATPDAAARAQAAALCAQARAAQRARDLPRAVALFRQAAALAPELPDVIEELAAAVYLGGDVVESAQLFDRALHLRMEKGG
jgi:hypothetical protein